MAVTRAKKIEQVEKLSGDLKNVSSVIVATYTKLTVAKVELATTHLRQPEITSRGDIR